MNYVDGYLIAVPTAAREDYRRIAEQAQVVFREKGALASGSLSLTF